MPETTHSKSKIADRALRIPVSREWHTEPLRDDLREIQESSEAFQEDLKDVLERANRIKRQDFATAAEAESVCVDLVQSLQHEVSLRERITEFLTDEADSQPVVYQELSERKQAVIREVGELLESIGFTANPHGISRIPHTETGMWKPEWAKSHPKYVALLKDIAALDSDLVTSRHLSEEHAGLIQQVQSELNSMRGAELPV
ncbi:hypothetical protein KOR42_48080 [Thalassoglobus neptunius]|uniref:Uncharacterized protein n=1 Tax=Thalassoglobus neptunius TaxID=1938619 RepID=A0A5C5VU62_9PLAN|nr:hypothetical protein [Thalassoglobus neptunius]TWT41455.1 hypothetical protein KOR42_48080 [Thalassoglobus neptunius]